MNTGYLLNKKSNRLSKLIDIFGFQSSNKDINVCYSEIIIYFRILQDLADGRMKDKLRRIKNIPLPFIPNHKP